MRKRRVRRSAAAGVLLTAVLAGCTVAAPDPAAYRERTTLALGDTLSHVATARLVLEGVRDGTMPGPYALATVRDSDDTLTTAVGAYLELYPPPEIDPRFRQVATLLGDAGDLVTASRIAVYRHDRAGYPRLIERLDALATDLERLEKDLS
jgi:hypothetical protein